MNKINKKITQQETRQSTIKVFLMISITIFLVGLTSASLGTFKQNNCVQIKTILNSTQVNISSLSYPNSTIVITNQQMTKLGSTFNYTFCNTTDLGNYIYDYYDELGNVYVNDFEITYTGYKITTEQIYVYLAALLFLVLLIFGLVFITNKIPSGNSTNENGIVINVNMLKHLRPILWSFIWIISIACFWIISNLGIAYLENNLIGNLFYAIYRILFYATMIMLPVYFVWIFYKIFKDNEMKKLIDRGVEIKSL